MVKLYRVLSAVALFLLTACTVSQHALQKIRPGLTEEEVLAIMKRPPNDKSFKGNAAKWVYSDDFKGAYWIFFEDGRVVAMGRPETPPLSKPESPKPSLPIPMPPAPYIEATREGHIPQVVVSDEFWSSVLHDLRSGFASERESKLRKALYGRFITARQASQVLDVFSFKSEQENILPFLIPAIYDLSRLEPLYKHFSFMSERERIDGMARTEMQRRLASMSGPHPSSPYPNSVREGYMPHVVVSDEFWSSVLHDISSGFASERETKLKQALYGRFITIHQAKQVLDVFSFKSEKEHILPLLIPAIYDLSNLEPLYGDFPFMSERERIDAMARSEMQRRLEDLRRGY